MKKEAFYKFCHAAAGFVMMYHALQSIEGSRDFVHAGLYLGGGIIFLVFAGIHEWAEKKIKRIDTVIFLAEIMTLAYLAIRYYLNNNTKYAMAAGAASGFFVLLFISSVVQKSSKHRHKRKQKAVVNAKPHTGYKQMED